MADGLGVPLEEIFNPNDFPPPEQARAEFYFTWGYHSFSVPAELKLAGVYDAAKTNADNKLKKATDEITAMMRGAALDLVSHLNEILTPNADGKKKRLHATAVTNISAFIEDFKSKNIVNDAELEDLVVNKLGTIIQPGAVDLIKDDEGYRDTFHDNIKNIQAQLVTLVEQVPGRKFKNI